MAIDGSFAVTVVLASGPRHSQVRALDVAPGCTATMAVQQSGLLLPLPQADIDALELSVWGSKVGGRHMLRPGDRVELLRPLTVDPKVARRERFAKQGAKSAGLFSRRRVGGKAGY